MKKLLLVALVLLFACEKENNDLLIGRWEAYKSCDDSYRCSDCDFTWEFAKDNVFLSNDYAIGTWYREKSQLVLYYEENGIVTNSVSFEIVEVTRHELILKNNNTAYYFRRNSL